MKRVHSPSSGAELERLRVKFGWDIDQHTELRDGIHVTHTQSNSKISFPEGIHHSLGDIEDVSPWYVYRNEVIFSLLQRFGLTNEAIWDVGAGTGCVCRYLIQKGMSCIAVEPTADGVERASRVAGLTTIQGRLEDLHLPEASLSCVGCFDVLEHLSEPSVLCQEIARVLKPGGVLLVTVPAFGWLWSSFDTETGHFARYTRRTMGETLAGLSLEMSWSSYFMSPYVIPVFFFRTLRTLLTPRESREQVIARSLHQIENTGGLFNALLLGLLRFELVLLSRTTIPIGSSLVCVLRKSD